MYKNTDCKGAGGVPPTGSRPSKSAFWRKSALVVPVFAQIRGDCFCEKGKSKSDEQQGNAATMAECQEKRVVEENANNTESRQGEEGGHRVEERGEEGAQVEEVAEEG